MPTPNKGEKRKDYISRCMGDGEMGRKYPDEKQRYAVCQSYWNKRGAQAMHENALIWYGSQSSAIEYLETVERGHVMSATDPTIMQAYAGHDEEPRRFGDYGDFIQAIGNVAIVPIQGSLVAKENWLTRMFGMMAYDTLGNIMAEIAADGGIDTVIMDIDSPGGEAKGLDAAVEGIRGAEAAGIKTVAHTSGQMASAAYWIGSTAQEVAASTTAEVGSVGVIAVHGEESERNRKEGLTFTVLRKGEEKALASPFEKLSDKARDQILESMDRKYQQFVGTVSENRGLPKDFVLDKIASGRVFGSDEALDLGMIDEIVTYNDLVSRHLKSDSAEGSGAGATNWSEAAMHRKPVIKAGSMTPEEAAIAVAAGADPDSVLPRVSDEPEGDDPEAEVEVVEGEESGAEDQGAEGAKAEPESSEEANAGSPTPAAGRSELADLVASLNRELVESRVENARLHEQVASLEAGNAGLREIAIEQTQRLRVSLGMPDDVSDLSRMSDTSLVAAHRENLKTFLERFQIGAKSRVPDEDPTPAANVTRLSSAVQRATRFK